MTIPAPLAYPPTALRNVAAGLVVGNPIGSSGTRAKALTSAELKAIVEASGISYLPLAGGTLTGPITGTGGLIEQRNGLTAQCLDIFETYTSGTNNGKLRFKATSSGHQIGSARATSGSNRAVAIGHFDASDVFAKAFEVATSGLVTVGNSTSGINIGGVTGSGDSIEVRVDSSTPRFTARVSGAYRGEFGISAAGAYLQSTAGTIKLRGTTIICRNGGDSADAALTCAQLTLIPPTSTITLSTNGHFSIEMTSNTAGNLVYRGSDGTTRRMALTFL